MFVHEMPEENNQISLINGPQRSPKGGVSYVNIDFVGVNVGFDNIPRIFLFTKLSKHF